LLQFTKGTGSSRDRHLFVFWFIQSQSSLHVPDNKELSVSIVAGAFSKLQQSSLNEPENTDVSVPTAAGFFSKLQQSSLNEPENKEVSVPTAAGSLIYTGWLYAQC
jgi:hypothetical protein